MAPRKEQDNFLKLCGDGDLESVTQLLDEDPTLIHVKERDFPCKI